jgi:DNA-binding transcriptional ArsR family regulator
LIFRAYPKYSSGVPETPDELDRLLRAVANPHRRLILQECWARDRSAGELAEVLDLAPASTSEHLKVLRKHGLVDLTANGTFRMYRSQHATILRLRALLEAAFPMETP